MDKVEKMKISEQELIDFGCTMCRYMHAITTRQHNNCAYRAIAHELCPKILEEIENIKGEIKNVKF